MRLGRRVLAALCGVGLVLGLTGLRLADPLPVEALREGAFDQFQRWAPRPAGDFPVRVVDVDELSLAQVGQWPWPRDVLGELTRRLGELGAAAIGFDMLFPEPDRMSPSRSDPAGADFDAMFASALAETPSILGFSLAPSSGKAPGAAKAGIVVSGEDPRAGIPVMGGAALPLPVLADAATGLGALSLVSSDSVGVIRRLPLLWTNGADILPSLSIEALRVAFGADTLVVFGETEQQGYVERVRIDDLVVPTGPSGDFRVWFRAPTPDLFVSAGAVLGADYQALRARIEGQIVLVGTSASGLLDLHPTPLGQNVPGVAIHAEAIEQMLAGVFLTRSDWVSGLEIAAFLVLGLAIVAVMLFVGPLGGLIFGGALAGAIAAGSWWCFSAFGLLVDPSFLLVGGAVVYGAMLFFQFAIADAGRRQIRRAFGHYVAPALLSEIERNEDRLRLGGETRELTLLFADVRNFTSLSEGLSPQRLLGVINTLFGALGNQITLRSGTIDKFMGDCVMAFWNAPVDVPQHPRQAALAALGMRAVLKQLNDEDAFRLRADRHRIKDIQIGIGMATGEAFVGNMGLESRFDYSCIGDTVNVASRVESACKRLGYDILATGPTMRAAPDLAWLEAGTIALKGRDEPETIHLLAGDAALALSAGFAELAGAHAELIAALRGGAPHEALLASCVALAPAVEPGLGRFYGLVARRREDFSSQRASAEAPAA